MSQSTPTPDTTARTETAETVTVPREATEEMRIVGEEAYWTAPNDEDGCTAMAAAYRAMIAAAQAVDPTPHALQDRLHGMLKMAVASEDSFNRLSSAGRRLIREAEGFFASSREDRDDLNACWEALQAETKRADAAEARLVALASPQHPVGVREAWEDAYKAFVGAFDTLIDRRKRNDDYANDARDRLRAFNDLMLATLSHPPAQDAPGAEPVATVVSIGGNVRRAVVQIEWRQNGHLPKGFNIGSKLFLDPSPPLPEADGEVVAWLDEGWQQTFKIDGMATVYDRNANGVEIPLVRQSALVSALRERDEAREAYAQEVKASVSISETLVETRKHYRASEAAREKAEQVAAGLREEGIEAAISAVRKLHDDYVRDFGIYDPSTNVVEFSGAAEDVDSTYSEILDALAALRASTEEGKTATPSVKDEEVGRG